MPLSNAADFPIWINGLIFVVAAVVIWFAGVRLVRALDRIAQKTGMGQAFVGMLLVGTITSLPEIANVTTASVMGNPLLAVNNLLGSASINLLLLAIVDAFVGRDALTSVVTKPATLLQATLCMLVLALVATAITTGDVQVLGVGLWAVVIFAASIAAFWLSARYAGRETWQPKALQDQQQSKDAAREEDAEQEEADDTPLSGLIWRTAIAGAVIFVAGYALSQTGDALAEQTGLGSSLVGFLLIGVATSMPELSTISAALRMRRHEMAIGEVLGTNFVNVALLLLADLTYAGGAVINEAGVFEAVSSLLGVLLTGLVLVGLLERRDRTIFRMGYDSLAVLITFAAGVILLYAVR